MECKPAWGDLFCDLLDPIWKRVARRAYPARAPEECPLYPWELRAEPRQNDGVDSTICARNRDFHLWGGVGMGTAALKFTQGGNVGQIGEALVVNVGVACLVENGDNSNISSWIYELMDAPIGSALTPAVLSTTSTATFTPDIEGCYRVRLIAQEPGHVWVDARTVIVRTGRGWILPAFLNSATELNYRTAPATTNAVGWKRAMQEILIDLEAVADDVDAADPSDVAGTIVRRAAAANYTVIEQVQTNVLNCLAGMLSPDLNAGEFSAGWAFIPQRPALTDLGGSSAGHYKFHHGYGGSRNSGQSGMYTHFYGDARSTYGEGAWIAMDNGFIVLDGYDTDVSPFRFTFSADSSTDIITTSSAHNFSNNQPVRLVGSSLPTASGGNLAASTTYYWFSVNTTQGKLCRTSGGAAIDLTSNGSGTMEVGCTIERTPWKYRFLTGTNPSTSKTVGLEFEGSTFLALQSTYGYINIQPSYGKPIRNILQSGSGEVHTTKILGSRKSSNNGAVATLFDGTVLDTSIVPFAYVAHCYLYVTARATTDGTRVCNEVRFRWMGGGSGQQANILEQEDMAPTESPCWDYSGDAAANSTLSERPFFRAPRAVTIEAVSIEPSGTVTADGTNYATVTIRKRNGTGGGATTIASLATDVAGGNWTAWTRKTTTLSNSTLAADDIVTVEVTKANAGVQLPPFAVSLICIGSLNRRASRISIADLGGGANAGKVQITWTGTAGLNFDRIDAELVVRVAGT